MFLEMSKGASCSFKFGALGDTKKFSALRETKFSLKNLQHSYSYYLDVSLASSVIFCLFCGIIIIIIIIIIIYFIQGIYTYIPETNYVPREYSVAAILLLLSMVLI